MNNSLESGKVLDNPSKKYYFASAFCCVMKIFSLFDQSKLSPAWSYAAHGSIWRILFSDSGEILGESRDPEKKQATFFCLDEQTGDVRWQDVRLSEPWWVGIDAVHRNRVLLHEFANPSMPEHRGIIALDLVTGKELWRNDELTFWFVFQEFVYAYKPQFEQRVGYKLSLDKGTVIEEYRESLDEVNQLRRRSLEEQKSQQEHDYRFPKLFEEESLGTDVTQWLKRTVRGRLVHGSIEYIQHQPYFLANFFAAGRTSTPESPILENHFLVYDTTKNKEVFRELLASDAKAPTPDSFFVKSGTAYFIKNQNILTALRLGT